MFFRKIQLVHEADKGTEGTTVTPPATEGGEHLQEPKVEQKLFTQEDINSIIDQRLDRERRQQREKEEQAKKTVEDLLLIEQGKFKELSDRREKEIGDLTSTLDGHKTALGKYLDHQRKLVPATVLTLLDKLPAVDQLDWIASNIEQLKVEQPKTEPPKTIAGVPPTPKPDGSGALVEAQVAAQREIERQTRSIF